MAAVNVTIIGTLTTADGASQSATMVGMASLTGLGVGGGPIIPPPKPPDLGIWPNPPEGIAPHPEHPIVIPPTQLPPGVTPPEPPAPGSPTTPLPPPAGQGGWPVTPMVPPPFIVVNYPGIGPVVVAPPVAAAPQ